MKLLFSLSFLLFTAASSINASFSLAEGRTAEDTTSTPILDATGSPLQFGVPYYMLPSQGSWGGGVSLASATPSQPCPKAIQVTAAKTDRGTPVVFSSIVPDETGSITTDSELIISFYNLTRPNEEFCGGSNSTTWGVTETLNLAIEEERIAAVTLNPYGPTHSYFLRPAFDLSFAIGVDVSGNLVFKSIWAINPVFVFQEAKSTKEDEDDKPVIIQMPRK